LTKNLIIPETLLLASVFLGGRYLFAHLESISNYNAGNAIAVNIKKELYPVLLSLKTTTTLKEQLPRL
jgi:ATP-binding cassette subfamily C protein CydD